MEEADEKKKGERTTPSEARLVWLRTESNLRATQPSGGSHLVIYFGALCYSHSRLSDRRAKETSDSPWHRSAAKLQCHPGYVVLFSHFSVFVKSAAAKSPPAFYFIFLQDELLTKPVDLTVEWNKRQFIQHHTSTQNVTILPALFSRSLTTFTPSIDQPHVRCTVQYVKGDDTEGALSLKIDGRGTRSACETAWNKGKRQNWKPLCSRTYSMRCSFVPGWTQRCTNVASQPSLLSADQWVNL